MYIMQSKHKRWIKFFKNLILFKFHSFTHLFIYATNTWLFVIFSECLSFVIIDWVNCYPCSQSIYSLVGVHWNSVQQVILVLVHSITCVVQRLINLPTITQTVMWHYYPDSWSLHPESLLFSLSHSIYQIKCILKRTKINLSFSILKFQMLNAGLYIFYFIY